ncbi:hypothetical protein EJB05_11979, partial [Eragrostis curvula]
MCTCKRNAALSCIEKHRLASIVHAPYEELRQIDYNVISPSPGQVALQIIYFVAGQVGDRFAKWIMVDLRTIAGDMLWKKAGALML